MYNCTYRLKTMTYPQQPKTEGKNPINQDESHLGLWGFF